MKHRYKIDPACGLLIDKFTGKMSWDDVMEGIASSARDPEFQPGMNVVADMADAELDFGYEETRKLTSAISVASELKYGRIAVIAPGPAQFGISRMFGTLAENFDIFEVYCVFSDISEARAWLGLPADVELRL